jgi:hypothetical protein
MSNNNQDKSTQNALNNFTAVFKRLFGNVEKVEQNLPNYKEWEKKHKEKSKNVKNKF